MGGQACVFYGAAQVSKVQASRTGMRMRLLALILVLICGGCATISTRRPNVLFLFADDQRADTISALGNPHIDTPNLDRLARSGFAFSRAYNMGSQVPAVCIPSRAMLLTGRGLFSATRGESAEIPRDHRMWPEVFRAAGYRTIGIGKWHNDRASFNRAFRSGGPVFFGGMMDHARLPVHGYRRSGKYTAKNGRQAHKHSSELFADAAISQIRTNRYRPFAMYVAFTVPHDPRMAPKGYESRYSAEALPLPANFMAKHPFDNGEMEVRDEMLMGWPRSAKTIREELAAYYASITHLDAQIGRILSALKETGLADNTIVVYSADSGLALGSHGLLGKQNLYEHTVRVPLILSGPGIPAGQSPALCYLYDVYPTLCELAHLPWPPAVEGKSLAPIMRGEQDGIRDSILCAYRDVQRSVSDERWKLITYPKARRVQLFDLASDPHELNDVSERADHENRVADMTRQLISLQGQVNDPLLLGP